MSPKTLEKHHSFTKLGESMDMPDLLAVQKESFGKLLQAELLNLVFHQPVRSAEPKNIHQPIPPDLQRAETKNNRVNFWECYHESLIDGDGFWIKKWFRAGQRN